MPTKANTHTQLAGNPREHTHTHTQMRRVLVGAPSFMQHIFGRCHCQQQQQLLQRISAAAHANTLPYPTPPMCVCVCLLNFTLVRFSFHLLAQNSWHKFFKRCQPCLIWTPCLSLSHSFPPFLISLPQRENSRKHFSNPFFNHVNGKAQRHWEFSQIWISKLFLIHKLFGLSLISHRYEALWAGWQMTINCPT